MANKHEKLLEITLLSTLARRISLQNEPIKRKCVKLKDCVLINLQLNSQHMRTTKQTDT